MNERDCHERSEEMSNEPWTTTALFCLFLCSIFVFSLFFLFFPPFFFFFFCSPNSFCCAALWFHWCNLCWCLNSFDISSASKFVFISFKKSGYLELQTVIWREKLRGLFQFSCVNWLPVRGMQIDFRCAYFFSSNCKLHFQRSVCRSRNKIVEP